MQFNITGEEGTSGYVDIKFPKVNTTSLKVYVDGVKLSPPPWPVITECETYYSIYFEHELSTHEVVILYNNKEPIPEAGGPYYSTEGTSLVFNASGSNDPDGDELEYRWDFENDGVFDTDWSTNPTASNSFMDDGIYHVLVEVSDGESCDTDTADVTVVDLAPIAGFTWISEPQDEGSPVQFTDTSISYPDEILGWSWDFGGLGTSTNQNPRYTFMDDGTYQVSLTVTDDDGSTSTVSQNVTVEHVTTPGLVTVKLLNSTNGGVQGGEVYYADGSWIYLGTTDLEGVVSMQFPEDTGDLTVRMTYGGKSVQVTQNVQTEPEFTFQTIDTTVELISSTNSSLEGGYVEYAAGSWYAIGTTGPDGKVQVELLPGQYDFRISYLGGSNTKAQIIETDPIVVFQTTPVTVKLMDSTGQGLEGGTVDYASGSWFSFGVTGPNGTSEKELLSQSYKFRVKYEGGSNTGTQDIGSNSTVVFQTVPVTVKLLDSSGLGLEGGSVKYAAGSWNTFGTTDANGSVTKELLPQNYKYKMTYAYISRQVSSTSCTLIEFQTGKVVSLTGTCTHYAGGSWRAFINGMELLPGNVKFRFSDGTPDTVYTLVAGITNEIH
jgi:PKD repeat protein